MRGEVIYPKLCFYRVYSVGVLMILSQAGDGAKCQFEKAYSICLLFWFCKAKKVEIGVQGHVGGGRGEREELCSKG